METRAEAKKCAELFRANQSKIDGVIVTLPNFGDEKAIAETLRLAGLNVPVLIHAIPRHPRQDDHRRPPRQLLRQDVGLQQPPAVPHSLLADLAAHRIARLGGLPKGSRLVRRAFAAWSTECADCASGPSARVPPPSTQSATARRSWKPTESPSTPSICPKSSAASNE